MKALSLTISHCSIIPLFQSSIIPLFQGETLSSTKENLSLLHRQIVPLDYLTPALPTLRRTTSSAYLIPLPL